MEIKFLNKIMGDLANFKQYDIEHKKCLNKHVVRFLFSFEIDIILLLTKKMLHCFSRFWEENFLQKILKCNENKILKTL